MYLVEIFFHPYLGVLFFLCSSCVVLVHLLRPIDLKWSPGKKKWAMPPGPPGVPVLGNLSQMMQARREPLSFNSWVGHLAFIILIESAAS